MLNFLKTASILASASAKDGSPLKDVKKESLKEQVEMKMDIQDDKYFGAIFTGANYNFFPVAFDTTIAETVIHDSYTTENVGKYEKLDFG
jgi:hypothetical protein